MSIVLPSMYHWSPRDRREKIAKRGLRTSTPTLVETFADTAVGRRRLLRSTGTETVRAVCLADSPSHAWSLCGAIWGERGETWDLWQVAIEASDDVWLMSSGVGNGNRLGEVRVCNDIPKSRVWHVGERTIGSRAWNIDS